MRNVPIPLVTGFYRDEAHPWSMQDVWNYMPCKAERGGTRSPMKLKTPPGLYPWLEVADAPPVRGIHDMEGRMFAVIGTTLYRLSTTGVAIPIGTVPGNGRVQMDHNQISGGNQLTVTNGSSGYVYDSVLDTFERITDPGYAASYLTRFMDSYMVGIDRAGRFAFNSAPANAKDFNTLNRWTSEYKPDRLVSMGRLGGDMLLLSANSGEFFSNSGQYPQPFRSKRIFLDKGCAGPYTVAEADSTVFWLGSDGFFYQIAGGYTAKRISTRPVEEAIRHLDWWNAFAFVWESEGHTCVDWTFLNGHTWTWDCSEQEWHRRESYGLDRWRVNCTTKSNGEWYAGDFQKGRIWRLDWEYPWEGDTEFVSGFTQPVIADNQHELIHNRLEIVMDTGLPSVDPAQFPAQPDGPTISGAAPDGLVLVAYAGYTYTLTPGDTPIVRTEIIGGSLPDGLTWDEATATISATTPTAVGSFTITLRTTDTNGLYGTLTDTISITELVPISMEWRYKIIPISDDTDYSPPSYDDSSWLTGGQPFGDITYHPEDGVYAHEFDPRFPEEVTTFVDQGYIDIWMRCTVTASVATTINAVLKIVYDGPTYAYLNGVGIWSDPVGGTPLPGTATVSLEDLELLEGENIIAIKANEYYTGGPPSAGAFYIAALLDIEP